MRKLFIIIQVFVTIVCYSQDLLTIREVYDYSIGDEFHFKYLFQSYPPNAERWKVIDKSYSTSSDTVFYLVARDIYSSIVHSIDYPFDIEYFFKKDTIKLTYSNLDSLIFSYDRIIDTNNTISFENSSQFCDRPINEITNSIGDFEPTFHIYTYGQGLGKVYEYLLYGDANGQETINEGLFYYNKNGVTCGIPDLTTSIHDLRQNIIRHVYPNPANNKIYLELIDNIYSPCYADIFDISGKLIVNINLNAIVTEYDISDLEKGVYFIIIKSAKNIVSEKFIKN